MSASLAPIMVFLNKLFNTDYDVDFVSHIWSFLELYGYTRNQTIGFIPNIIELWMAFLHQINPTAGVFR